MIMLTMDGRDAGSQSLCDKSNPEIAVNKDSAAV